VLTLNEAGEFPSGLVDLYYRFFATPRSTRTICRAARVIEPLLAAYDGLTEQEMSAVSGLDEIREFRPTLSALSSYLSTVEHSDRRTTEPRMRLLHKSLAERLRNPPAGHRRFRLDRVRGQERLLEYCRA